MSKFWPSLIPNKMTPTYSNVAYTSESDFTDFMIKNYFQAPNEVMLREVADTFFMLNPNFDRPDRIRLKIVIADYVNYADYNWLTCNYFLSNFTGLNDHSTEYNNDYSFWFVEDFKPQYSKTNELIAITFDLKLDVAATYYYQWVYYSGIVNIRRMHNNRFRDDDIFGSPYKIFDFVDNEYIKYCDAFCQNLTSKTQLEKSQVLISDRNISPETLTTTNTPDTIMDVETKIASTNIKFCYLIWATDGSANASSVQNWTAINDYLIPMKLYVLLVKDSIYDDVQDFYVYLQQTLKMQVQAASVCEYIFESGLTLKTTTSGTEYYEGNSKVVIPRERFFLLDVDGILTSKLFFQAAEIAASPTIDARFEPHVYTSNHYEITLGKFQSNKITFDVVNLLQIAREYDSAKYYATTKSLVLAERTGLVSPEQIIFKTQVLDNDLSLSAKINSGVFTQTISGDYTAPYFEDSYYDFMRTKQAQYNAGINSINTQASIASTNNAFGFAKSGAGGAVGGFLTGGAWGAVAGAVGGLITGGVNFGVQQSNIEKQKDAALQSFNAPYIDQKAQSANISLGSASTSQADVEFSATTDELDQFNTKKLWTPILTITELKQYEKDNIAYYYNKYGYSQNRWIKINSFNDLFIRKFWNRVAMPNADELFSKNKIHTYLIYEFVSQLQSDYGVCFWDLDKTGYNNIYNYELNNYEHNLDTQITKLQNQLQTKGENENEESK